MAKEKAKTEAVTSDSGNKANLPPFYTKPVPLHPERHGSFSLKEEAFFEIAKDSSSIILNAVEFAAAARDYPIVFAGNDEQLIPVSVLGLKEGTNLFLDKDSNWADGTYIPAYIRRYPFIFMEGQEKEQLILCIDEESELLVKSEVRPLFDKEGNKTNLTERALQFCAQYQKEFERTKAFTQALVEKDLLTTHRADISLRSGQKFSVGGFRVIDEAKFNKIDDKTFLEWRKLGYIGLIYCHLVSAGNWQNLVNRTALTEEKKTPKVKANGNKKPVKDETSDGATIN